MDTPRYLIKLDELYDKLEDKYLTVDEAQQTLNALYTSNQTLQREKTQAIEDRDHFKRSKNFVDKLLSLANNKVTALRKELRAANEAIDRRDTVLKQQYDELEKYKPLVAELTTLKHNNKNLAEKLMDCEHANVNLRNQVYDLQQEPAPLDQTTWELNAALEDNQELRKEIADLKYKLSNYQHITTSRATELDLTRTYLREANNELKIIKKELEDITNNTPKERERRLIRALRKKAVDQYKQIHDLEGENEQLARRNNIFNHANNELRDEISKLRKELEQQRLETPPRQSDATRHIHNLQESLIWADQEISRLNKLLTREDQIVADQRQTLDDQAKLIHNMEIQLNNQNKNVERLIQWLDEASYNLKEANTNLDDQDKPMPF